MKSTNAIWFYCVRKARQETKAGDKSDFTHWFNNRLNNGYIYASVTCRLRFFSSFQLNFVEEVVHFKEKNKKTPTLIQLNCSCKSIALYWYFLILFFFLFALSYCFVLLKFFSRKNTNGTNKCFIIFEASS